MTLPLKAFLMLNFKTLKFQEEVEFEIEMCFNLWRGESEIGILEGGK